jgi:[ribosomal protein S5]-alanine N-acetyltransferase
MLANGQDPGPQFGWVGEMTRLVPLERDKHLENCVRWINDPEVTENTLIGDFPLTVAGEEAWFDAFARNWDQRAAEQVIFAIETRAGEHIGLAGIHKINYRYGEAWTGTLIGRKDLWGKGYATDAVTTRTRYAFDVLGLRFLCTEVFHDNPAMQRVLAKAGFQEVGRIPRRTWKRGRYRDVLIYWLDREGWAAHGRAASSGDKS